MITPFNQKPIVKMIIQRGLFSRLVAIIKSKENLVLDFFLWEGGDINPKICMTCNTEKEKYFTLQVRARIVFQLTVVGNYSHAYAQCSLQQSVWRFDTLPGAHPIHVTGWSTNICKLLGFFGEYFLSSHSR